MILLGVALGFLIGAISGIAVLLLIRMAASGKPSLKSALAEISQLLAIPTFCFGGPWVTTLLTAVELRAILPAYAVSLSLTFALVAGYPLTMLVIAIGNRIGRVGVRT